MYTKQNYDLGKRSDIGGLLPQNWHLKSQDGNDGNPSATLNWRQGNVPRSTLEHHSQPGPGYPNAPADNRFGDFDGSRPSWCDTQSAMTANRPTINFHPKSLLDFTGEMPSNRQQKLEAMNHFGNTQATRQYYPNSRSTNENGTAARFDPYSYNSAANVTAEGFHQKTPIVGTNNPLLDPDRLKELLVSVNKVNGSQRDSWKLSATGEPCNVESRQGWHPAAQSASPNVLPTGLGPSSLLDIPHNLDDSRLSWSAAHLGMPKPSHIDGISSRPRPSWHSGQLGEHPRPLLEETSQNFDKSQLSWRKSSAYDITRSESHPKSLLDKPDNHGTSCLSWHTGMKDTQLERDSKSLLDKPVDNLNGSRLSWYGALSGVPNISPKPCPRSLLDKPDNLAEPRLNWYGGAHNIGSTGIPSRPLGHSGDHNITPYERRPRSLLDQPDNIHGSRWPGTGNRIESHPKLLENDNHETRSLSWQASQPKGLEQHHNGIFNTAQLGWQAEERHASNNSHVHVSPGFRRYDTNAGGLSWQSANPDMNHLDLRKPGKGFGVSETHGWQGTGGSLLGKRTYSDMYSN